MLTHVRRALRPSGVALIGFHRGQGTTLKSDGSGGHPMHVHIRHRRLDQVAAHLQSAGLVVDTTIAHNPEPAVAGDFVLAHRPDQDTAA